MLQQILKTKIFPKVHQDQRIISNYGPNSSTVTKLIVINIKIIVYFQGDTVKVHWKKLHIF